MALQARERRASSRPLLGEWNDCLCVHMCVRMRILSSDIYIYIYIMYTLFVYVYAYAYTALEQ